MSKIIFKIKENDCILNREFESKEAAITTAKLKINELISTKHGLDSTRLEIIELTSNEKVVFSFDELMNELKKEKIPVEPKEINFVSLSKLLELNQFELFYLFKDMNLGSSEVYNLISAFLKGLKEKKGGKDLVLDQNDYSDFLLMNFPFSTDFFINPNEGNDLFYIHSYMKNLEFKSQPYMPNLYFYKLSDKSNLVNLFDWVCIMKYRNINISIEDLFIKFLSKELEVEDQLNSYKKSLIEKIDKYDKKINLNNLEKVFFVENDQTKKIEDLELKNIFEYRYLQLLDSIASDTRENISLKEEFEKDLKNFEINSIGFKKHIAGLSFRIQHLIGVVSAGDYSHLDNLKDFLDNRFSKGNIGIGIIN